MTVSVPYNQTWTEKVANGGAAVPGGMDLRIGNATSVKARMIALSDRAKNVVQYMRDHPLDFVLSTVSSIGTYMAARALVQACLLAIGLGGVAASAIAIAVITSGLMAVGRTIYQERKARKERIEAVHAHAELTGTPPSAEDLATARSINVQNVLSRGIRQAAFTGLLSGTFGLGFSYIYEHLPKIEFNFNFDYTTPKAYFGDFPMTNGAYQDFLGELAGQESGGDYTKTNSRDFLGKYQMGEPAMKELGYYTYEGDSTPGHTKPNTWQGRWTGKDGVWSRDQFLNSPAAQENAVHELMRRNWAEIVDRDLDRYVGMTVKGVPITKSGLLAGAHLGGVGGLENFLTSPGDPSDGARTVGSYVRQFGGHGVPFEVDNPHQVPFELTHCWPVDPRYGINSAYGMRHGVLHSGVDIAAPGGTPVYATEAGTVVEVNRGWNGGYGNQIIVEHAGGWRSWYNHLSAFNVTEGQHVDQQDMIGNVGNTGRTRGVTGNHLHYELHKPGVGDINPAPYMNKDCWTQSIASSTPASSPSR